MEALSALPWCPDDGARVWCDLKRPEIACSLERGEKSTIIVYHFLLLQYSAIRCSRLSIWLPLISKSVISTIDDTLALLGCRLCPSLVLPGFQGRSVPSLLRTLPYFTM